MSSICEKCNQFDEATEEYTLLGIRCDLCKTCFRSWARRYHKNPDTTRFEILTTRLDFLRATSIGKPLKADQPFAVLDSLVQEREAVELKLVEDTIDWVEETI